MTKRNIIDFDYRAFVHMDDGTVDRVIFSDEAIYEMELERIFARAWNFMCHESQIPKAGDFFLNFIGEESVIATRDKKGELQVLLNSCRHRGNAVCRAESGNARSFLCTYHGWTYGLDGQLIGVPGYKDFYHEQLDKSQWGLVKAGKVASYKGFVFATMDPEAPDLEDYLGPVGRMGMDLIAEKGDLVMLEGVQKNQIDCNWKLAVDNLFDFYHVQITHSSMFMSGYTGSRNRPSITQASQPSAPAAAAAPAAPAPPPPGVMPRSQRVVFGEFGHAIGGPIMSAQARQMMAQMAASGPDSNPMTDETWRDRPSAVEALGELGATTSGHPNIFPNLWITPGFNQISLRLPKGPNRTEIWWFSPVDKNLSEQVHSDMVSRANHVFGPAGLAEQDDGENWGWSTRGTRGAVARRYPLNFSMNIGQAQIQETDGVSHADTNMSEHAQMWTWNAWADWMDADSWASLKRDRTPVPRTGVI